MEKGYNGWLGVWKSVKNNLYIWVPALLAFLANVPPKYTPIASIVVYFIKNFYEYNYKKKK